MHTVNLNMNEAAFIQLPLSSGNPLLQTRTVTVLVHFADSSQKVLRSGCNANYLKMSRLFKVSAKL